MSMTVEEARKILAPLYEALNRPAEKDVAALGDKIVVRGEASGR